MKINLLNFIAASLQRKLMLALIILVALVMSAIGGYWLNNQRQTASAELEARATQMADLLAKTLAAPLWNLDMKSIHDQLDAVMADSAVFSAALYERGAATPLVYKDRPGQPVDAIQRQVTVWYVRERPAETVELGTLRLVYTRYYVYQALGRTALLIAALVLSLVLAMALVTYILLRRMVQTPVQELVALTGQIAGGDLQARIQVKSHDEIGQLARACNRMAEQLQASHASLTALNRELEDQVASRTRDLERRAAQITAGADIARVATTLLDPNQLIPQVVQLIQERFDFYYVGLFLLDAAGRYAVLQYGAGAGSASDAGRLMKERGHKLAVGPESMIGWACANRQARIALDVGQDAVRFANPLLPDTHSEMALPLRVGERVIGALSVQSEQTAAFDQGDIAALQGMADQIAVALETARLFQQTQATLKELEMTNRLLVRHGWQAHLERPAAVRRVEFHAADAPSTGPLSQPLTLPLELRGQPLGRLSLRREGKRAWSDEEVEMVKTIALQTALAADNVRLVEQTQAALRETEGLFSASQAITGAVHIQDICHILAQRFNELVQADRTILYLVDRQREHLLLSAGYGNLEDDPKRMTFQELNAGISGIVLRSGQPVLSLSADDGIEPEETRQRRRQSNAGALIVVPLAVKGQVIGTVTTINRADQRPFTQHDVDLLMALAAQAATAIENVRLLQETQQRAEREQLIRHITTRVRAAGDVQGILETTADELARGLGVSRAIVRLTMGEQP